MNNHWAHAIARYLNRKLLIQLVAVILISAAIEQISPLFGAPFVDPRLDSWLKEKETDNSFSLSTKRIIVYFRELEYHDRSGENREQAILEERSFAKSWLASKIKSIATKIHADFPADRILWGSNAAIVDLNRSALKLLTKLWEVEGIVADDVVTLDDPKTFGTVQTNEHDMTYGLQLIHADAAWKQGIQGDGVVVGVIDSGVDQDHPDLKGKIIAQKDFTEDNDNVDYISHGTHVSGTIVGGNASGTHIGVAPHAKIIMAKVFAKTGSSSESVLLRAMEWMLHPDNNPPVRVISNSWGGSQFSYGFRNVIREWRRFQILPNFAAGNSGTWFFSVGAPGSYPFSFAVGAIDENSTLAPFSGCGPTVWWKNWHPQFVTKPDITSPGLEVLSSMPGGTYGRMSGTSMATPHITGVIALALQANPQLTVEDTMDVIAASALDPKGEGKNNSFGSGIIQVDKVIDNARHWNVQHPAQVFRDQNPSIWAWETP